jgi:hypothetical protein
MQTSSSRLTVFTAGSKGEWKLRSMEDNPFLPKFTHLNISSNEAPEDLLSQSVWTLRGVTSNTRYIHEDEEKELKKNNQF